MKQRESRTKSVRQQGINRNPTTKEIPKPNQKALLNSSQTAIVLRRRRIEQPKPLAVGEREPTKDKTFAWGARTSETASQLNHGDGSEQGGCEQPPPSPPAHAGHAARPHAPRGTAGERAPGRCSLVLGVEPVVVFPKDAALIPEDAALLRALSREVVGGAGFALVSLRDQGGDAELLVHRVHLVPQDAVLPLNDVVGGASLGLALVGQGSDLASVVASRLLRLTKLRVLRGEMVPLHLHVVEATGQRIHCFPVTSDLGLQHRNLFLALATFFSQSFLSGAVGIGSRNLFLGAGLLVADARGRERDHGTRHLRVATSIQIVHGGGRKGVLAGSARAVVVAGGGEADRRDGPAPPLWPSSREDCSAVLPAAFFDASAAPLASKSLSQAVTPKFLDLGFGMSW
ncbi:uncharacterized protein PG986_010503 [Apiospora aurea]|uniref:Uncharacterized protein n=1 Tax=Apiospora aurea TaxID=335848 RepID=A0ABR1Q2I5_9PEZI